MLHFSRLILVLWAKFTMLLSLSVGRICQLRTVMIELSSGVFASRKQLEDYVKSGLWFGGLSLTLCLEQVWSVNFQLCLSHLANKKEKIAYRDIAICKTIRPRTKLNALSKKFFFLQNQVTGIMHYLLWKLH